VFEVKKVEYATVSFFQRSSIWRFPEFEDFHPVVNADDNQVYCGGFTVQHHQNGGKCGICGDNYAQRRPRDNESGGKYDVGLIVRNYTAGSVSLAANSSAGPLSPAPYDPILFLCLGHFHVHPHHGQPSGTLWILPLPEELQGSSGGWCLFCQVSPTQGRWRGLPVLPGFDWTGSGLLQCDCFPSTNGDLHVLRLEVAVCYW